MTNACIGLAMARVYSPFIPDIPLRFSDSTLSERVFDQVGTLRKFHGFIIFDFSRFVVARLKIIAEIRNIFSCLQTFEDIIDFRVKIWVMDLYILHKVYHKFY